MVKSATLLVLSGCIISQAAAAALGHNQLHVERNAAACNQDNLLRCFIDTRYAQQASDFFSGLGAATVTVTTPLATATATEWLKVAINLVTEMVTATTTVFTGTVPSATVTVTRTADADEDEDEDDGSVHKPNGPANTPYCMTYGTTFPAPRVTSACSCIDVPAATVKVTVASSTKTLTQTMISSVASTTSKTVWNTISTGTTSGILTVTADAQTAAHGPANADPPLNLLFNSGSGTSGMKYWDLSPSTGWTPTISSMALSKKASTSIPWASIGYLSLKNPDRRTELKLQLDVGTAVGSLNWNVYEAAVTMTKGTGEIHFTL